MPPDVPNDALAWMKQAAEELTAARLLASDGDVPPRLAAFLAHLAAEKALKGTLIARGIAIRRIHDLVVLQRTLPVDDAAAVSSDDIDLLVPWNIAGRYPADLGDTDLSGAAASTVDAAGRIVAALTERVLPDG